MALQGDQDGEAETALRAGVAALADGAAEAAERHFRRASALRPGSPLALQGLGKALHDQSRLDEAEEAFRAAGRLGPDRALADYHVGLIRLLRGDAAAGWIGWEARLAALGFPAIPTRRWDGRTAPGERILVLGEQGFGDVIQFARFLPAAARAAGRGADLTFGCAQPLLPLLAPFCAAHDIAAVTGQVEPRRFDRHVWLCSLPGLLGLGPAMHEDARAYLALPGPAAESWRRERPGGALCVGLCWEGRASHPQDRQRSIAPEQLMPLARVPGVALVGLQRPPLRRPPPQGLLAADWGPRLEDFATAAAMLGALDLLVTVDTALAHLAGALGLPALVLLPRVPDWRWGLSGEVSAWYPSLRLLRQERPGDWSAPVAAAVAALGG